MPARGADLLGRVSQSDGQEGRVDHDEGCISAIISCRGSSSGSGSQARVAGARAGRAAVYLPSENGFSWFLGVSESNR